MRIFIVEDDSFYSKLLEYQLSLNPENEIEIYTSGQACLNNLHRKPDVITLDYSLPDMTGIEVLKKITQFHPGIPVIVISGQEDVSTAVDILKNGAYDYIIKNDETKDRIWHTIHNIHEKVVLEKEVEVLRKEVATKYDFGSILKGNSNSIKNIFSIMEKACTNSITVSICGETGTGKELVAKAIHYNGLRKSKPFVAVNMAAIPNELLESELFGYEKGAFTGALNRKSGKFEEANGGTIFLDEIAEIPLAMQAKLLRVLQEREVCRIGGNQLIKLDLRIVVATHRNLLEEVKKGNFREDLYYRLLGLPIELPPLRNRGEDVIILAKYFMDQFCKENRWEKLKLSDEAKAALLKYSFPGNIRELKAIMELACVMAEDGIIQAGALQLSSGNTMEGMLLQELTLKEYTQKILQYYLEKYQHNVLLVAEKLDVGKSTIYRMIQNQELI
ncbi:MAG: sigma-54 dependent transcriptional regulator [Cytophagaceae bacterium]|nr:sigma-54 dependent transcriptional regulator [Cytophagaceae bacterium]